MCVATKIKWSADKYRIALQGDELPGLRSVARGFGAAEGYDLRRIDEWSSSKKRRVRDYYEKMYHLLAQEKRVVRPRTKRNLRILQDSFHGDVPSLGFNVAFVPYVDPKRLPGAKPGRTRIRYTKRGVVLKSSRGFERLYEAFDKRKLATNPNAEIKRAFKAMPEARLFFVQVGEYQTLNGVSPRTIAEKVNHWMAKYDGVSSLSGKKKGENPENHDWRKWLNGIVGYSFSKSIDVSAMQRAISEGMKQAKAKRAEQSKVMKRKSKRRK